MPERTCIPFGPQHPVLPEPIHLDLILDDETVVDAIPSIGYIHRGLEDLVRVREYQDFVYVAERICGICSFIHGLGYCMAIEEIMKVEVPARAQWLRVLYSELSRVHSHLLWLGLAADAFGFENLFMQSWKARETVLDIIEELTGGRVIFGSAKIGGVRADVSTEQLKRTGEILASMGKSLKPLTNVFVHDSSVRMRLTGVGVLSAQDAFDYGAVGPMLRASGTAVDMRKTGYCAYGEIDFDVVTENAGDCMARVIVRVEEIYQSIKIIEHVVKAIPEGPFDVKVTGMPDGEAYIRLEQPRGEVMYYAKGNGTKFLDRFRVRTPTFANVPPMIKAMSGTELAHIPDIVITIDPCISCTER